MASLPGILETLGENAKQVLVATASGPHSCQAAVEAWERLDGEWRRAYGPVAAVIGRCGLVAPEDKREGDGCTPRGIYELGMVFGTGESVATRMPYRRISEDDCWVDDPASSQYNRWVNGVPEAASWERMLRPDGLYRYGIVIEYNTKPVVAGRGSAIFVHLWRGPGEPTSGCLAMSEADLTWLLAWLRPESGPVVALI